MLASISAGLPLICNIIVAAFSAINPLYMLHVTLNWSGLALCPRKDAMYIVSDLSCIAKASIYRTPGASHNNLRPKCPLFGEDGTISRSQGACSFTDARS